MQNSGANIGSDGIGYTFFSYGNVGSIANQAKYGYIALNNVDPIFASYGPQVQLGSDTIRDNLPRLAHCRLPLICRALAPRRSLARKTTSGLMACPSRTSATAPTPHGRSCGL